MSHSYNLREKSSLAGQEIEIKNGKLWGAKIIIEDWWQNVYGASWMFAKGNPACLKYAVRAGLQDFQVPDDDEVLYGHINGLGELVHISEVT